MTITAILKEVAEITQSAPAPRFSRTPAQVQGAPPELGQHTEQVLAEAGFGSDEFEELKKANAIGTAFLLKTQWAQTSAPGRTEENHSVSGRAQRISDNVQEVSGA